MLNVWNVRICSYYFFFQFITRIGFDELRNTPGRNEKCVHKTVVTKLEGIISDAFIYMTTFYESGLGM